jgi:transcriptional regulator with XRE-family HTH domain
VPAKKSAACIALGKAVRTRRIERGHSQESFARYAKMDRSYLGSVERGEFNVSLDIIVKVAKALGVTAASLLKRAGL